MTLTPAEVQHLRRALNDYREVVEGYPEVISQRQEDNLLIAEEIMREDSNT